MRALVTGAPCWLGNRFLEILVRGSKNEGYPINDWNICCLVMEGINASFINSLSHFKKIEVVSGDIITPAIPLVLYGIMRYLYLIYVEKMTLSPMEAMVKDKPILLCVGMWMVLVVISIAHFNKFAIFCCFFLRDSFVS